MDAGSSSEPTLHQMQPVRPSMMRPPGPTPVQRRAPSGQLPPTMFRFQSVKTEKPVNGQRPKIPPAPTPVKQPNSMGMRNGPPPRPVKPPGFMARQHVHHEKQILQKVFQQYPRAPSSYGPPSMTQRKIMHPHQNPHPYPNRQALRDLSAPSTSSSEMAIDEHFHSSSLTRFPVFESVAEVFVNADSGQVEDDQYDEHGNKIELPPNCKLFNYKCRVEGVDRTLLVPMPMDCTEEDVMKILPESFSQFAQMLKQNPQPPPSARNDPTISFSSQFPHQQPEESCPYLVNQKQYLRIQRRRTIRQRLEMTGRLPLKRQKYLHESRHLHAINRKRGHDGRFDQRLNSRESEEPVHMPAESRFAQPLDAPVTTYAEIRPAQSRQPPLYYHPNRFRVLNQPVSNPPSNLTPVNFSEYHHLPPNNSDFHPSTSSSSEPITSYQQYQEHVQYSDLYSNPPRDMPEGHEKFTNL